MSVVQEQRHALASHDTPTDDGSSEDDHRYAPGAVETYLGLTGLFGSAWTSSRRGMGVAVRGNIPALDTRLASDYGVVRQIVQQVVDAVQPLRVVLFGSRARGVAHAGSDIDLLVEMPDGADRLDVVITPEHDITAVEDVIHRHDNYWVIRRRGAEARAGAKP